MFNTISLNNRHFLYKKNSLTDKKILPLVEISILAYLIIGIFVFQYWHEVENMNFIKEEKITIGEFTLMVSNMPAGEDSYSTGKPDELLRKIFEQDEDNHGLPETTQITVKEISLDFFTEDYEREVIKMYEKTKENFKIHLRDLKKIFNPEVELEELQNENRQLIRARTRIEMQIEDLSKHLESTQNKFKRNSGKLFSGVAFVTLSDASVVDQIFARYSPKNFLQEISCCSEKKRIMMEDKERGMVELMIHEAREPGDVIWDNLDFRRNQRLLREYVTIFLIFLLCCLGMFAIYLFETSKVNFVFKGFLGDQKNKGKIVRGVEDASIRVPCLAVLVLGGFVDSLGRDIESGDQSFGQIRKTQKPLRKAYEDRSIFMESKGKILKGNFRFNFFRSQ
jgi:hypothetical protein